MSLNELDSITKNLVQEIIRECTNRNVFVSHDFVIYYVKLLLLDPTWKITFDDVPQRTDSQKFVKYCLRMFEDQTTPQMIALKMQLFFHNNFETMQDRIIYNRADLRSRLLPLENDILESDANSEEEYNMLEKKIVYLITLYSGLGNPSIEQVYKEAKKAMQSVFKDSELKNFASQSREFKEATIVELTELTAGIRLFNRDCHKGSAGIEDLPTLLDEAVIATIDLVEQHLLSVMNYVNTLTTAIDTSYTTEFDEQTYVLKLSLPDGITDDDLTVLKNILVVFRQFEMYLRTILLEVSRIDKQSKVMFSQFQESLLKLHETVKFKNMIPSANVYPLFSEISHDWCELQNLTILISHTNQMVLNLYLFTTHLKIDGDKFRLLLQNSESVNDIQGLTETVELQIAPPINNKEAKLVDLDEIDFQGIDFQYLGFCPWKMIETNGALIPGNPNMGVIVSKNLYFCFSSVEAAAAFGQAPFRYILQGLNLARNKPELIDLLSLKSQLHAVRKVPQLVQAIPPVKSRFHRGLQTDIHGGHTQIDPSYKWNVWDWKRQAILLANLSTCKTHSTQTTSSQARGNVRIQTYSPRNVIVQTKKDNYTNVPTLSNFIYGLRGRKTDVHHIITLTRPVDE